LSLITACVKLSQKPYSLPDIACVKIQNCMRTHPNCSHS
jgi:hypothetical protein